MRLRRPPDEYFFAPGKVPAKRIGRLAQADLDSWATATVVALWEAVDSGHIEEAREQMAILNDLLVERSRRVPAQ